MDWAILYSWCISSSLRVCHGLATLLDSMQRSTLALQLLVSPIYVRQSNHCKTVLICILAFHFRILRASQCSTRPFGIVLSLSHCVWWQKMWQQMDSQADRQQTEVLQPSLHMCIEGLLTEKWCKMCSLQPAKELMSISYVFLCRANARVMTGWTWYNTITVNRDRWWKCSLKTHGCAQ